MDLLQGLKAVLADALVSEGADKARDVSVLRWAARLDQDVLDVMLMSPHPEPLTGELQSVIDFDRLGGGPKRCRPVQPFCHVRPTQAEVCGGVHALACEVVSHRAAFDTPRRCT